MSKFTGLPYFSLDCQLDDEFKLVEAEYGLDGFAVIIKLFQKIYGHEGYYCHWTNEVALLFSREIGMPVKLDEKGGNAVSEIVKAAIRRGIFNKDKYDKYSILTSRRIQETYLKATKRRTEVFIREEYLLIDCTLYSKNVDTLREIVSTNEENVCRNQQRKEKERIGEESRGEKKCAHALSFFDIFWEAYPRNEKKAKAREKWLRLKIDEDLFHTIMDALKMYKQSKAWKDEDGKYIPHAITFLNQKRWEDTIDDIQKETEKSSGNQFLDMLKKEEQDHE